MMFFFQKLKDIPVNPKRYKLKKMLWLISIARNALVVVIASSVAFVTYDPVKPLFKLSGNLLTLTRTVVDLLTLTSWYN